MIIDIHTHILPDFPIDVAQVLDPDTEETEALAIALEIFQHASQQGVSHIIATPHIYPGENHEDCNRVRDSVAQLQQKVTEAGIEITLFSGAEVAFCGNLPQFLPYLQHVTLAGSKYLLIEPPLMCFPLNVKEIFAALRKEGFYTILSHPERVFEFQEDPERLKKLVDEGILVQITAAALADSRWYGPGTQKWCEGMLKKGLVHFVASDVHIGFQRNEALPEAWSRIARLTNEETARKLMYENPLALIEGGEIG